MADISKINSTAVGNLSTVSDTSKGSTHSVSTILMPHGVTTWVTKSNNPSMLGYNISELVVYNNKLYAAAGGDGILWEWNGSTAFVNKAPAYYPAGHEEIINFCVYHGTDYLDEPGTLLCMSYGEYPWGGNCLAWNGTEWTVLVPQTGTISEGWYQPHVAPGGLVQYWNGETWSLHAVTWEGEVYGAMYMGTPGASWGRNASRVGDWFNCATVYGDLVGSIRGEIYIGTRMRYGIGGGKLYKFNGTGYDQFAPKYEPESWYGSESTISRVIGYNYTIYGMTAYGSLRVLNTETYEWDHVADADPGYDDVAIWALHGSYIYGVTATNRLLYSSGGGWTDTLVPAPEGELPFSALASYNGKLYAGGAYGLYELDI